MGIEVLRCAHTTDLSRLTKNLWQSGIQHRVDTLGSLQILSVPEGSPLAEIEAIVQAWMRGEDLAVQVVRVNEANTLTPWVAAARKIPLTSMLLLLSAVGFYIGTLSGRVDWLALLSFEKFAVYQSQLAMNPAFTALQQGEIWRLLTPIFIHFGWLHIVFNGMWLFEFGRLIERRQGSLRLASIVVVAGVVSNASQAYWDGGLFGGMSGVIYALLGYCWLFNKLRPGTLPGVSPAIFALMVGWLLLCLSGIITAAGFGNIANTAHVSGLLIGFLLAVLLALVSRQEITDKGEK